MSVTKTYVLLDHTKPSANVSIQINQNQRVKIGSRKFDRPAMQISFTDKDGRSKVIRFKLSTSKIFQDEQIKDGILANEKFQQREYDALAFRHGFLVTKNKTVQEFLDIHPQNEAFWKKDGPEDARYCPEILQPLFKEYSRTNEVKLAMEETKQRVAAANKILAMDLEAAHEMILRLNGSHANLPKDLDECQNMLIDWADNTDLDGIETLLRSEHSTDEKATLLVAKAVGLKIISFDVKPGTVVKLKGSNQIHLKDVPTEMSFHDQQLYFAEFLLSDAGKLIYLDLEKEVANAKEPVAETV